MFYFWCFSREDLKEIVTLDIPRIMISMYHFLFGLFYIYYVLVLICRLRLLHLFHSDGEPAALFHVNISCVVWYWSCIQSIKARLQAYTGKLILH